MLVIKDNKNAIHVEDDNTYNMLRQLSLWDTTNVEYYKGNKQII